MQAPQKTKSVVMGDAHANVMKMLDFAESHGIITSDDSGLLRRLNNLYERLKDDPTNVSMLKRFNRMVSRFKAGPGKDKDVYLLGDIVGDRGVNDFITLFFLYHLKQLGINVQIAISNHDWDNFVTRIADMLSSRRTAFNSHNEQRQSAENLDATIYKLHDDELDELERWVDSYKDSLNLVLTIEPTAAGAPTVMMHHAPISERTFATLKDLSGRGDHGATANARFRKCMQHSRPHEYVDRDPELNELLKRLVWDRCFATADGQRIGKERKPETHSKPFDPRDLGMLVMHGHDSGDTSTRHEHLTDLARIGGQISLDEDSGKHADEKYPLHRRFKGGVVALDEDNKLVYCRKENPFIFDRDRPEAEVATVVGYFAAAEAAAARAVARASSSSSSSASTVSPVSTVEMALHGAASPVNISGSRSAVRIDSETDVRVERPALTSQHDVAARAVIDQLRVERRKASIARTAEGVPLTRADSVSRSPSSSNVQVKGKRGRSDFDQNSTEFDNHSAKTNSSAVAQDDVSPTKQSRGKDASVAGDSFFVERGGAFQPQSRSEYVR